MANKLVDWGTGMGHAESFGLFVPFSPPHLFSRHPFLQQEEC